MFPRRTRRTRITQASSRLLRPAWAGLLLLVVVLPWLLRSPPCRAAELTVGIVGLDAVEIPEAAAQTVTDLLRQRAARISGIKVMPGSKELVELKLIFGCMEEKPECLAVAGRSLGADRLIFGSVRRALGGGYTVVLKQMDVRAGLVDRFISDVVPGKLLLQGSTELGLLAQRWLNVLLLSELHGGLRVSSDPPGAEVTLDGSPIGRTPIDVPSLPSGDHVVTIDKPGYAPLVRKFEIKGGLIHDIDVALGRRGAHQPVAPAGAQTEGEHGAQQGQPVNADSGHLHNDPGKPFKLASYFLLGAAVVAGGVAIYTWRNYDNDETAARSALDVLQMNLPGAPADVSAFFHSAGLLSSCQPPADLAGRVSALGTGSAAGGAYQAYLDHCRHGNTYANATTGLVATMGSLALLGVVSYIIGEHRSHPGRKSHPDDAYSSWFYPPRLRTITPLVNRSGGGVDLSFQF